MFVKQISSIQYITPHYDIYGDDSYKLKKKMITLCLQPYKELICWLFVAMHPELKMHENVAPKPSSVSGGDGGEMERRRGRGLGEHKRRWEQLGGRGGGGMKPASAFTTQNKKLSTRVKQVFYRK